MAKCLTIAFPTDRDQFFMSRVLDFGEALYRPVVHGGIGILCDLDKFTGVIWIEIADPHDVGRLKAIVRKQLGQFQLTADATVSLS
jgi:hypothetical protein